ncbi:MAG: B12-binding domain-containing radical SAM protein [Spirochaetales bacterium]|nr:B12-binding domain-containing radical SAM protein [Spirochaetales bacterium]
MRVLFNVSSIKAQELLPYQEYPFGLLSLVSYLNARLSELTSKIIVGELEDSDINDFAPDVIGLSATSVIFSATVATVERIRKLDSHIPIVIGGAHISFLPHNLPLKADVAVLGEGEITFYELCRLFMRKKGLPSEELRHIKGIAFRENGELIRTDKNPLLDIKDVPVIECHDICEFKEKKELHFHVMTSRGCPYKCRFCASSWFWGKIRQQTPEATVNQIQYIVEKYSPEFMHIFDDLFTFNKSRLKEIQRLIVERKLHKKTAFECWVSGNTFDEEVARLLKEMNVVFVSFGLESGSPKIYKYLKGSWNSPEKNKKAVELAHRYGFIINTSMIIGIPGETIEDMKMTYDYIKSLPIDDGDLHLLTPYPGTEVWRYARERNLVTETMDDWHVLEYRNLTDPRTIYLGDTVSRADTLAFFNKISGLLARKRLRSKLVRRIGIILHPRRLLRRLGIKTMASRI